MILYLNANLLLVLACLLHRGILLKLGRYKSSHLLQLQNFLAGLVLFAPTIPLALPKKTFLSPSAQIWAGPTLRTLPALHAAHPFTTIGSHATRAVPYEQMIFVIFVCAALGGLFYFCRILLDGICLFKLVRNSYLVRRQGMTQIRVSDSISVPFSFWIPKRAYVMLPSSYLADRSSFCFSVRHEIQHHRQGDTVVVYLIQAIRILFSLNPFSYFLERQISRLQEFACDETLVDHKNVPAHAYSGFLVQAAELTLRQHAFAGTTGMAVRISGSLLKRRIKNMMNSKKKMNTTISVALTCFLTAVMAAAALGSQGLIKDRRISLTEAIQVAEKVAATSSFPIVVNERVLEQLNRFVGTPDGREFIQKALSRMELMKPMLDKYISTYQLPKELLGIPIIESAYKNRPAIENPTGAAGLWQFMAATARNYNLRVDDVVDERLDVEKETDCAMRLLNADYLRFQDWLLAVLAYNAGEFEIQRGINQTHSRDAWLLINKGFAGKEPDYLAKAMAAILILNNPSWIN